VPNLLWPFVRALVVPADGVDQGLGRMSIRKTRLAVNIVLKAKAPEALHSGAT